MTRTNFTERIGVNETERLVIKNLGWIFREQPIVDVGIDAIIEQVNSGEPMGKFIAVQIKSGIGNFHKTDKGLTHYITNVHYNYWLNLNIPMILVAHLPNEDETYWIELNKRTFKKSKKRWKIEIPFKQKLNENAIPFLEKITSEKNDRKFDIYRGRIDSDDLEDITEDVKSINDATECINNITAILKAQTKITNNSTVQLSALNENPPNDFNKKIDNLYKSLAKSMNLSARRSEIEIELFSQLYSVGISAFEKIVINLNSVNLKFKQLGVDVNELYKVPEQMDGFIHGFIELRNAVNNMPTKHSALKEAKNQYVEVLDLIINEAREASEITKRIFMKIK